MGFQFQNFVGNKERDEDVESNDLNLDTHLLPSDSEEGFACMGWERGGCMASNQVMMMATFSSPPLPSSHHGLIIAREREGEKIPHMS